MMKKRYAYLKVGVLLFAVMHVSVSQAGEKAGNGGDLVRQIFLQKGEKIVAKLETNSEGQALASKYSLDLQQLRSNLSTSIIKVVDRQLIDNTGSVVDAIGVPGSIELNLAGWTTHILSGQNLDQLVFHEVLRAAAYNDDDYIISKNLGSIQANAGESINPAYDYTRALFMNASKPTLAIVRKFVPPGQPAWWSCQAYDFQSPGIDNNASGALPISEQFPGVYYVSAVGSFFKLVEGESLGGILEQRPGGRRATWSIRFTEDRKLLIEQMEMDDSVDGLPAITNPTLKSKYVYYCE